MMRSASFFLGTIGLLAVAACSASGNSDGNAGSANAGGSSATGNGGNGGSGAIGLGGSGNGSGTGGGGQVCDADVYTGVLLPLDMYVMLDRSGSMEGSPWSGVTSAFQSFVSLANLDGLGMGIAFFPPQLEPEPPPFCDANGSCGPNGVCFVGACIEIEKCEPTDYATPIVPIAPLPGVGPAINQAIAATKPTGDATPTRPALAGAMMYAIDWAQKNPDHITVVVLATDGEPTGCTSNSVSDVSAAAALGLNSNPSVRTFVVGIGDIGALNSVAQAGGTNQAIIVSTNNAANDFLDALNSIRGAFGCSYKIPTPSNSEADPNKVNVAFTPDGGTKEYFPKVKGASECQGEKGWHYDDEKNPTLIVLCPAACDLVTNKKGKVDVELGCTQIIK